MRSRGWLIGWLAAFQITATGTAGAAPLTPEWVEHWRADLAFAADSLPRAHPNWFHTVTRERYRAALDSLSSRLPSLKHHEIVVDLARIVASAGEGHTRLTLPFDPSAGFFTGHATTAPHRVPGLLFRHYPIRYRLFRDGLHVVRADSADRDLLGGRVVSIGSMTVAAAIAAVEPAIHRDNDRQLADLLPDWLACPEILHARGVVADMERLPVVVEHAGGRRRTGQLHPVTAGATVHWREARAPGPAPLTDRFPDRRHWYAWLPEHRAIYARYREAQDDRQETVAEFASRLFVAVDSLLAERLVLDLRGNHGGDGSLNRPLVQGMIRAERLWRPGGLCALIDRGTFSAAVMLAADLEKSTPALLLGEKSGGRPNSYGDSRRIVLPNSGITVRVSSLYWQSTGPRDTRDGITPHLPVETTFDDWRRGRDPALDRALAIGRPRTDPAGAWDGILGFEHHRLPVHIEVSLPGPGRAASLTCEALGLECATPVELAVEADELRTMWRAGQEPLTLVAHAGPDLLVGLLRHRGSDHPVVFTRSSAPQRAR